ncbi:MAG: MFS transporter [Alphaproteobacteria bacterium]|nr:MFS transporter [Alphaproteobacteria bacterium]
MRDPSSGGPMSPTYARLSLFYAAQFLVFGVMVPFWPAYLGAKGLGPAEIGLLMGAGPWVRIIAVPTIARAADRSGRYRTVMAASAAGAMLVAALFAVAEGLPTLFALSLVLNLLLASLIPLGDAAALQVVARAGLAYGRVRLWGSLSFIGAAAAAGAIVEGRTAGVILVLVVAGLGLSAVSVGALPALPSPERGRPRVAIGALLRSPPYLLSLLAAMLLNASHAVYYAFGTIHWQRAGLAEGVIGLLWAEGVIAEVLLFLAGAALARRLGVVGLFALAGVSGLVRWVALALDSSLATALVVQALHAGTFGAMHLATMEFMARALPRHVAATAQTLHSALAAGIGFGLTMLACGWLYGRFAGGAYLAMAGLSALGLGATALLARCWRGERIVLAA